MFDQATSTDSHSAISSLESAFGATRFAVPDGQMIDLFGLVPVRANLSARQAKALGLMTSGTSGSKGFRQVCKLLGAKEPEFRAFLHDEKIMYKLGGEWVPFAQHLDAGRFEVKAGTSETSGHAFNAAKFTAKGVEWVAGEWAKHKIKEVV